jgi:hypothetical protein
MIAMLWVAGCSDNTPVQPSNTNQVSKFNSDVPVEWMDLQMMLIQDTPGFTPPVAARALGYSGIALYEALVPGMPDHRSLAGQLNGLTSVPKPDANLAYHWPTVASSALATISTHLFAELPDTGAYAKAKTMNLHCIDSLSHVVEAKFMNDVDTAMRSRSLAYGKLVADAIYEWSKTDGGHEGYLRNFPASFTVPTGPGMWVPTSAQTHPMQPYWGQNRPFVLPQGNPNATSDPGAPLAYSTDPSSAFYKDALEVYNTVNTLTPEQKTIALFWSDDPGKTCTPPGHSMSISCQCLKVKSSTLDFAAESCAKIGIAVNDAFIACWETKYKYNLIRPISYIQQVISPTFTKDSIPLSTPGFPEYTSGHSVQSAAAAEVLANLFGGSFTFTDHTHDMMGMAPRTYASFDAFAQEAAISRMYGGIHYRAAIERGIAQGKKIGDAVNALHFKN